MGEIRTRSAQRTAAPLGYLLRAGPKARAKGGARRVARPTHTPKFQPMSAREMGNHSVDESFCVMASLSMTPLPLLSPAAPKGTFWHPLSHLKIGSASAPLTLHLAKSSTWEGLRRSNEIRQDRGQIKRDATSVQFDLRLKLEAIPRAHVLQYLDKVGLVSIRLVAKLVADEAEHRNLIAILIGQGIHCLEVPGRRASQGGNVDNQDGLALVRTHRDRLACCVRRREVVQRAGTLVTNKKLEFIELRATARSHAECAIPMARLQHTGASSAM